MQALDVEQIHGSHHAEAARRQHDAAQAVETDPESPGELVGHVGDCAQPMQVANIGGVKPERHDDNEYALPKSELDLHRELPFFFSCASASATSCRRWEIQ